jgi:hypothetical protein
MSKKTDYPDLDDGWEDEDVNEHDSGQETLLESFGGTKDARRRLDDLLEERRLRAQMDDDF